MNPNGIAVGLRGATWGWVDPTGTVGLTDRRSSLGWWVAADDRWHDPRTAPSIRQRRIDGTPVVETKLAVPGGDVVQRVFVVADQGGCLVARYENRSPTAVVVAVPTGDLATTAATAGTAPQGIDLPTDVRAFPLSHGGVVAFAWPLEPPRRGGRRVIDAAAIASEDQVVRGWLAACEQASRVPLPDARLVTDRCEILLSDVRHVDDLLRRDPALALLAIGELVRMGDPAAPWVEGVADAARRVARRPDGSRWTPRALGVAAWVLARAGEHVGADDVLELWRGVAASWEPRPATGLGSPSPLAAAALGAASVEDRLVRPVDPEVVHLLPDGIEPFRGANVEAHGVFAGPRHRLSFALRWHGPNVALLWEIDGPPGLRLAAPGVDPAFSTSDARGEALLVVGS